MRPADLGLMPREEKEIVIPARRIRKPERELSDRKGHDKIISDRKAVNRRLADQEAEDEIQQVLRHGSGRNYLDSYDN